MTRCVLCGAKYPNQVLRSFPRNTERRKLWFDACNLEYREGNYRLCLAHFSEDNLELKRMDGLQRLKPYAVPDIIFPEVKKNSERLEECQQNAPTGSSDLKSLPDHVYELHFDENDKIDTYEMNLKNGDVLGLEKTSHRVQKSPKNQSEGSKRPYNFRRENSSPSSAAKRKNVASSLENNGINNSLNHEIGNPPVDIRVVNTVNTAIVVEEIHEIVNVEIENSHTHNRDVNTVNNALILEENYEIENIEVENPVLDFRIINTVDNVIMLKENMLPDRWTVHKIPDNSVAYLKWGPNYDIEKKIIALPDFKIKVFFGNDLIQVHGLQSVSSVSEMSRLIDIVDRIEKRYISVKSDLKNK